MIISNLVSAIQGLNERFDKFSQRILKIWSMILEPLSKSHVTSMFFHNIHHKLKFIALDYMKLPFTEIMHRLTQKKKYLVDMGDLKYGNPNKETKEGIHHKKDDKKVHSI